ncbi:MAG: SUMF1/EgtB/PvdO family nonheme iron enzyme [Deltaproteobacteria bacterium]|nr:SUMF1/EgtB/PvdO family nonheme iron enzyme [Deltaproteobacteria bacterium]
MVTINRTTQALTLVINSADLAVHQGAEASVSANAVPEFSPLSPILGALRRAKHSLFSSLYSSVGSGLCARPALEFFDQEICTQSFALQLGIAVAAGIPAGFAGRAAGQGLIAFVGNNALGRVAAFCIRIPVTHLVNQYLSGNIQAYLSHQSYSSNSFSAQDLLSMGNLGAAEVLGHALGGSTGSFILGRLIGGATNCVATGLEIFAGHQINKVSRQILHRNVFEAVEQREVWRDALNWRELIKNSVTDAAFCVGHGMFAVGSHLLRRVGPPCPTANGDGRPQRAAPTVESPSCQDFIEFAGRIPEIWHQTQLQTLMLAMGAVGEGGIGPRTRGTREDLSVYQGDLADLQRRLATTRRGDERREVEKLITETEAKIAELERVLGVNALAKAHPLSQLMSFVRILGGRFRMGEEGPDAYLDKRPVQELSLPDFGMTETVVTNAAFELYQREMSKTPYALIATEKGNPFCWVVGRFETEEDAQAYFNEVIKGEAVTVEAALQAIIECCGNDDQARAFFSNRQFDLNRYDQGNPTEYPNGLRIERVVPTVRKIANPVLPVNRPNQPAHVSWVGALGFCDWAGRILTGQPGRLPSAAEAEFVRRGGVDPQTKQCRNFKYGTSDGQAPNAENADFNRRWEDGPLEVDAVPPGPLGVRINGVLEWCNGWYRTRLEGLAKTTAGFRNPVIINGSIKRELRGFTWDFKRAENALAARRDSRSPNLGARDTGFRVVVAPRD